MKLTHIRLHPFGRFRDESRDLSEALVVIDGANEAGKSTLRQAIFHALFTPTNLTPKKLRDTLGRWFPEPGGDHAAVTLSFEQDGKTWTLTKRFGAGAASTLNGPEAPIADPKKVQDRLAELLRHGEGTYRHVLFTGQAELERTLDAIRDNAADLRDIADLLKAGADASGDVDEQKLRHALTERIEEFFGRWDDQRGRPEKQAGQEKGIEDQWRRGCGTILAAWYAWQTRAAAHDKLLGQEEELDRTNQQLAGIAAETARDTAFLAEAEPLRDALNERKTLEAQRTSLVTTIQVMDQAFKGWPKAEANVAHWQTQRGRVEEQRSRLLDELGHAQRRQEGERVSKAFDSLVAARAAWQDAERKADDHAHPDREALAELDRLEKAVTAADNKLAARTLDWRIESVEPVEATVERGTDPAERIEVTPAGTEGTATARVRVRVGGVTLTVDSGGNVSDLLASRARDGRLLAEALTRCGAVSVAAAHATAEVQAQLRAEARVARSAHEALLGEKTFEQWQADVADVAELPQTRDVATINEELGQLQRDAGGGESVARTDEQHINGWKAAYGDMDSLAERLFAERLELKACQAKLDALPTLPAGFTSVEDFLGKIREAQSRIQQNQTEQFRLGQEGGRLDGEIGTNRSQDLAELAAEAKRGFDRVLAEGRAHRRILAVLDQVAADKVDPLIGFTTRVNDIFSRVTGIPSGLSFDRALPTGVTRDGVSLLPTQLSQGAHGALALAVRLAMAEVYANDGGFVMLDDPLVHFDARRMAEAAAILRAAAGRFQVLFFTCHEHHAEALRAPPEPPPAG